MSAVGKTTYCYTWAIDNPNSNDKTYPHLFLENTNKDTVSLTNTIEKALFFNSKEEAEIYIKNIAYILNTEKTLSIAEIKLDTNKFQ